MWSKLGKYVSAVVIACFFLPFFGVSCDGMDVITISGADMVGGCKPGGLITAAENQRHEGQMTGGSIDAKIDNVDVEPLAIAALLLVVIVLVLSLRRTREMTMGALVASILALGVLAGLYVKVGSTMRDAVAKETASGSSGGLRKDMKVDAGGRFGLWMVGIGLVAIAGMAGSALRARDQMAAATDPPRPPPPMV
jgi:hypothetical protein